MMFFKVALLVGLIITSFAGAWFDLPLIKELKRGVHYLSRSTI